MASVRLLARRPALAAMLKLQGHTCSEIVPSKGLHPLVVPFASADPEGSSVLGLLRWPLGKGQQELVVSTQAQTEKGEVRTETLNVQLMGTIAQYARRIAVEADANGDDCAMVEAASNACIEAGGPAYMSGEFAASKLKLPQFLLLKVGTSFPDVWYDLARLQLQRGDETAAMVAAERGSAANPGWGSCLWQQAQLMDELGRTEERRDLALAALEVRFTAPPDHTTSGQLLSSRLSRASTRTLYACRHLCGRSTRLSKRLSEQRI